MKQNKRINQRIKQKMDARKDEPKLAKKLKAKKDIWWHYETKARGKLSHVP